jgi:uracil-DNA glycosylase
LAVLGTAIERVGFVEAVRCRPSGSEAWRPGERVRQRCRRFLLDHLLATKPRLVLPLGLIAATSCLEVTVGRRAANLDAVVGVALAWPTP